MGCNGKQVMTHFARINTRSSTLPAPLPLLSPMSCTWLGSHSPSMSLDGCRLFIIPSSMLHLKVELRENMGFISLFLRKRNENLRNKKGFQIANNGIKQFDVDEISPIEIHRNLLLFRFMIVNSLIHHDEWHVENQYYWKMKKQLTRPFHCMHIFCKTHQQISQYLQSVYYTTKE